VLPPVVDLLAGRAVTGLVSAADVTPSAEASGTPSPSATPGAGLAATSSAWAPTTSQFWLVVTVFVVLTALWGGLVTYNLLAGGRALRRTQEVLGLRPMKRGVVGRVQDFTARDPGTLSDPEMALLRRATRSASMGSTRLTRTLLALLTFSLISGLVVVIFTEDNADDLRKQTATALLTFLATIGGFYFGSDTAQRNQGTGRGPSVPPTDGKTPGNTAHDQHPGNGKDNADSQVGAHPPAGAGAGPASVSADPGQAAGGPGAPAAPPPASLI
jgi:hypothetical protein